MTHACREIILLSSSVVNKVQFSIIVVHTVKIEFIVPREQDS